MLRQASLYGSAYRWESHIAAALRVDSALTTPSTNFLVAALIAQSLDSQVGSVSAQVSPASWLAARQGSSSSLPPDRAAGCARIAPLLRLVDVGEANLREGGNRYTGGGAANVAAALSGERSRLAALRDLCA